MLIENFFNIEVLLLSRNLLLSGLSNSLKLIFLIVVLAMSFGLLLAVIRHSHIAVLDRIIIIYVDIIRSMPILVLLLLIYYALPFIGVKFPPFWAATLAMSLNGGAYFAEIFRSGIEAIDRGQTEAARSLGLSYLQTMGSVILPQAMRIVLPPLTTNTLELIKASAVASLVAMADILRQARQAQSLYLNPSPLIGALIMYLIILLPLVWLGNYFESRFKEG